MGVVWEAIDQATGQPRAIKLVHPDTTESTAHIRFVREAEALRGVSHPNVVKIFEIARDDDGAPAIVMELLRGESLATRIEREKALSVGQACAILARVTAAVATAHAAGIIHRDLKPDNVFVIDDGAGHVDVRVLDFGVARKIESTPDKLTKTGTLIGTPFYMSPEQASGEKDLDGKSDVWSLAVIAFECLTGTMPIHAENYGQLLMQIVTLKTKKIGELRPDLPKALVDVIDGAFVDRERRIDIAQIQSVFTGLADARVAPPPPAPVAPTSTKTLLMSSLSTPHGLESPTIVEPPRTSSRSAPVVAIAIGALSLLALAGGVITYRARSKVEAETPPPIVTTTTAGPSVSSVSSATSTPSASTASTVTPPPPASASASASAAASVTKKTPPPKPTTSGAATSHPTPATTSTDRLQGGVGGNVPF